MSATVSIVLLLCAAAFGVFLWVRLPQLTSARGGRVILLLALLVMPVLLIQVGVSKTLGGSKQKEFCTSCHEMEVYDVSLHIDDSEYVPANHYQNRLVPQDTACYTCHTDYTLYGDVEAKMNGLKHVWVHYFGDVPAPGEIKLYSPYPNDNCLQCHRGGRRFEKKGSHTTEGVTLELLYTNQKSCVSQGCHDKIHDISHIARRDLWGEPQFKIPDVLQRAKEDAAEDPFGAEEPGGAEDPFADEAPTKDGPDAGTAAPKPASELDNPDDLWGDEDAGAAPAPAGGDDVAPAPAGGDDAAPAPAGGDDVAPAPAAPESEVTP